MEIPPQKTRRHIPRDINEAARLLLADLLNLHLKRLSKLSDKEFDQLCDRLAPLINEEYQLYQGNMALLESCIEMSDKEDVVPAQVILDRMMQLIRNGPGLLIIA